MALLSKRFGHLPIKKFMTVTALVGVLVVPVLWSVHLYLGAIAALLFVLTILVQAACIDFGKSYDRLDHEWLGEDTPPTHDQSSGR